MVLYKTPLGTIAVLKAQDQPITEIKLAEGLPWYKLPKDSYYVEVKPKSVPSCHKFLGEHGKDEYDVLLKIQKSLKLRPRGMYPQVVLDIIDNAISNAQRSIT